MASSSESGDDMKVSSAAASPLSAAMADDFETGSVRIATHSDADYRLSWCDHQLHLIDYFESLYQNELLVDVTLACRHVAIRAHRVVLSACRYFISLLNLT